jgi:hypothetical protein
MPHKKIEIGDVLGCVTIGNNRICQFTVNFIDESSVYFESETGEMFTATKRDRYVAPPILRKI